MPSSFLARPNARRGPMLVSGPAPAVRLILFARALLAILLIGFLAQSFSASAQSAPAVVHVDATPSHVLNSFDPDSALGSSIDVLSRMDIDRVYTPHIIQ